MKPQKFIEKVVNKATKFLNEENLSFLGYSVTGEVLVESGIKNPYLNLRFPNHEVVRYNLREDYDIHEEEDVSVSQSFAYIKRNILHDIREYDALRETESYNLEVESDEETGYDESEELDTDAMENSQQDHGDEDTVNVQEQSYDEEVDLEYTEDSFEEDDEEYDEDDEIDVDLDEDDNEIDEDEIDEDDVNEECDDYSENWSDAQKEEYFSDYDTDYEGALGQTLLKFLKWKLPLHNISSDGVNIKIGEGISQVSFNIGLINNEYQTNSMDFNEFGIELLNRYRDEVRNRLIGTNETEQNSSNSEENVLDSKDEMEDSSVSEEDYSDDYFPF